MTKIVYSTLSYPFNCSLGQIRLIGDSLDIYFVYWIGYISLCVSVNKPKDILFRPLVMLLL